MERLILIIFSIVLIYSSGPHLRLDQGVVVVIIIARTGDGDDGGARLGLDAEHRRLAAGKVSGRVVITMSDSAQDDGVRDRGGHDGGGITDLDLCALLLMGGAVAAIAKTSTAFFATIGLLSRVGSDVGFEDVLVSEIPETIRTLMNIISGVHVSMHPDVVTRRVGFGAGQAYESGG